MSGPARVRSCLLMLASMVVLSLRPADAHDPTWVEVLPADGTPIWGGRIDVEVWVQNVQDLYGADVQLSFDPTRLAAIDANPSTAGVQLQPRSDLLTPDFVIKNEANNIAGTIWYAVTQLKPSEPVSGSGALVSIAFQTLTPGTAAVSFQSWLLARRDGTSIPAAANGAVYDIQEATRLFLPSVTANYSSSS